MAFTDEILLKLRRKYSKDEEVKLILQELSAAQIEVGMLKSDVAELKHKLTGITPMKIEHKKQLLTKIAKLEEENTKLLLEKAELLDRIKKFHLQKV